MASKIPDFLNPLMATSGLLSNACHPDIIQEALGVFTTCNVTSTLVELFEAALSLLEHTTAESFFLGDISLVY